MLHFFDYEPSPTDRDRAAAALEPGPRDSTLNRLHHGARVFNRAVRDHVGGEGGHPQGGQAVGPARLPDADGLHPARAYVEPEDVRRPSEERHIKSLSP